MALLKEIVQRTISGETDKRLQLGGGAYVRALIAGSDWTKLRVGIRLSTCRTTTWTSPPVFYVGLCSGVSSPPGSASPQHFLGWKSAGTSWTYSSPRLNVFQNGSQYTKAGCIQAGVESFADAGVSGGSGSVFDSTSGQGAIFFEITKGSPFSITLWIMWGTTLSAPGYTAQLFSDAMATSTLPSSINIPFQLNDKTNAVTVDESTYGALDTVCFSWLGEGVENAFEISDIAVRRLA